MQTVEYFWVCGVGKLVLETIPSEPLLFHTFQGFEEASAEETETV